MYRQPTISPCGSPPRRWPVQSRPTVKWCQRRCKRLQTCRPADIQLLSRSATGWVNLCKLLKVYKEQNCWIQNAANFRLTLASIGYKKVVLSIIWKNKGFFHTEKCKFSPLLVSFSALQSSTFWPPFMSQSSAWLHVNKRHPAICCCVCLCACACLCACVPDQTSHGTPGS